MARAMKGFCIVAANAAGRGDTHSRMEANRAGRLLQL